MNNTANTPLDLKVNNTETEETALNAPATEAEEKEAQTPGVYKITFNKPLVFEDKEYSELTFDFNSLTVDDAMSVERELSASGIVLLQPEISTEYLIRMAARACTEKISFDIFSKFAIRDYIRVKNKTRNFLLLQA